MACEEVRCPNNNYGATMRCFYAGLQRDAEHHRLVIPGLDAGPAALLASGRGNNRDPPHKNGHNKGMEYGSELLHHTSARERLKSLHTGTVILLIGRIISVAEPGNN